jgi:hypothetical protein
VRSSIRSSNIHTARLKENGVKAKMTRKKTMMSIGLAFFESALALLLLVTVMGPIQAAALPDLSGKWSMNRELSEDAKAKLEKVFPTLGQVAPRGGDKGTQADARDAEREQARRRIEALIEASETLDITQINQELTVVEGNLRERKLYTDGRPFERQDRRGNMTTIRARWQGQRLVVDTSLPDGGKFTESYELSPGGEQLFVTVTSQDRRLKQPLVIHRVYDAVPR